MSSEVAIDWDEDSRKYTLTIGTKVLTSLKAASMVYYQIKEEQLCQEKEGR